MQALYKLIFIILVLQARRDELRKRCPLERSRVSKGDLSRDEALPDSSAALAPTR